MALPAGNSRPPVSQSVLERLKAVAGPGGYLDKAEDVAPFARSWRGNWQGNAPLFLRPRTVEEMAAIVRICAETDTAIVPQGGNTGLTGASQPHADMSEVIVTTQRLRKIRNFCNMESTRPPARELKRWNRLQLACLWN